MPNILQIARDVLSGREYPSENIFEMKLKAYAEHEHHGGSGHPLRPAPLRLHNAVPGGCDYHRQYADGPRPIVLVPEGGKAPTMTTIKTCHPWPSLALFTGSVAADGCGSSLT